MTSLRERNRRAAMEHIQNAAFELFEKEGYHGVKVADIARAAQVSESTFYRLFQTKEGLFTATPWEPGSSALEPVNVTNLGEEVRRLVTGNEWRGMRWVLEVPEVRRAVLATLDDLARGLAERLHAQGTDRLEAAARARHLLFAVYFSSLETWHQQGRTQPFESYFDRALSAGAPTLASQGGRDVEQTS